MAGINFVKVRKYFAGLVKGLGDESGMGVVEVVLIIIEIFIFNVSVYNVSIV